MIFCFVLRKVPLFLRVLRILLSNARQFYSSFGCPLGVNGLTTSAIIDKTVGKLKVSTFDVFIASLPSTLFNVVQN